MASIRPLYTVFRYGRHACRPALPDRLLGSSKPNRLLQALPNRLLLDLCITAIIFSLVLQQQSFVYAQTISTDISPVLSTTTDQSVIIKTDTTMYNETAEATTVTINHELSLATTEATTATMNNEWSSATTESTIATTYSELSSATTEAATMNNEWFSATTEATTATMHSELSSATTEAVIATTYSELSPATTEAATATTYSDLSPATAEATTAAMYSELSSATTEAATATTEAASATTYSELSPATTEATIATMYSELSSATTETATATTYIELSSATTEATTATMHSELSSATTEAVIATTYSELSPATTEAATATTEAATATTYSELSPAATEATTYSELSSATTEATIATMYSELSSATTEATTATMYSELSPAPTEATTATLYSEPSSATTQTTAINNELSSATTEATTATSYSELSITPAVQIVASGTESDIIAETPMTTNLLPAETTVSEAKGSEEKTMIGFQTTLRPTLGITEWMLNTSDAYDQYWVKTVIEVPMSWDVYNSTFRALMEARLALCYNIALSGGSNAYYSQMSGTRRAKRAVTVGNATVQMTNITREASMPLYTDLVYYLVQDINANSTPTTALETVALMLTLSIQQEALILGFVVISQATVYVPLPVTTSYLWVIGVVLGSVVGLILLIWLALFIYFKCTRPPRPRQRPGAKSQTTGLPIDDQDKPAQQQQFDDLAAAVSNDNARMNTALTNQLQATPPLGDDRTVLTDEQPIRKRKKKRKRRTETTGSTNVDTNTPTVFNVDSSIIAPSTLETANQLEQRERRIGRSRCGTPDSVVVDVIEGSDGAVRTVPAIHTPMYIDAPSLRANRPPVEPWSPYTAGDISRQILKNNDNVNDVRISHELELSTLQPTTRSDTLTFYPDIDQRALDDSALVFSTRPSTNQYTAARSVTNRNNGRPSSAGISPRDGNSHGLRRQKLETLVRAGLLPSSNDDSYTRVVLTTRSFVPAEAWGTNSPVQGSTSTGQPGYRGAMDSGKGVHRYRGADSGRDLNLDFNISDSMA